MLSRLYCFRIKRWGLFAAILLPDRSGYDQSTYLDIVRSTNRLYVLTNEQYVINFVDIITHRIADKFYIAIR